MKPLPPMDLRLPAQDRVEPRDLFGGRRGSIELEIGSGVGGFLLERLAADADCLLIGLEVRHGLAALSTRRLLGHAALAVRARVFHEDARLALPRLAPGSVARVHIHFPDPWWKKRHAKRRLSSLRTLGAIARVLEPGGELFIQSDVERQVSDYELLLDHMPEFEPAGDFGTRLADNPFGAQSPRERRADRDGLPIYRLLYRRAGARAGGVASPSAT